MYIIDIRRHCTTARNILAPLKTRLKTCRTLTIPWPWIPVTRMNYFVRQKRLLHNSALSDYRYDRNEFENYYFELRINEYRIYITTILVMEPG